MLAALGGLAQASAMAVALWFVHDVVATLPRPDEMSRMGDMAQATVFYDAGDRAAFSIFEEQRREVPLSEISPQLVKAIIAIEDQRFYEHNGVDVVRIGGALLANLRQGRRAQGGSTITQQLARQSFLTTDKTWRRKVQEALLAVRIESKYEKDRILELYLNKVYFGAGFYGAEAASLGFFGKSAKDLTVAEAAMLAGLVKSPSTWAPTVNPERALARRDVVLGAMREFGALDADAFEAAKAAPIKLENALAKDEPYGQFFKEMVRQELVDRFGRERVYQGGLRVYTTIDLDVQKAADAAVAATLKALDARRVAALKARAKGQAVEPSPDEEKLQAAVVALDPRTGAVRAMVGGRQFGESHFNRAVQARRQPGSAFKPFVYAAALEAGYTPATLIRDLDLPVDTLQGDWTPDDEHGGDTELTLRAALRTSSNRAAVRLIHEIGVRKAVDYARKVGLNDMPAVPSLALGSGEVSLLDLTAAYAVFADKGIRHTPYLIRRVEDQEGEVLFEAQEQSEQAVTPTTAFLMSNMLADVINSGTAWKARQLGFKLPAAGKTGTTNEYRDAWFIGFTPKLAAGVWVGFDTPKPIVRNGYAADVAVPLWASLMKDATAGDKPEWLATPKGVIGLQVCRLSGKRPGDGCGTVHVVNDDGSETEKSMIYTEYFVRGTQPEDTCPLHQGRSIFGKVAGLFGGGDEPAAVPASSAAVSGPPSAEPAGEPEATATAGQEDAQAAAAPEAPKKKRGFWSRVFGRGDKDDKDKGKDDKDDRDRRDR